MNQESRIEVIDRDGWRKDYPLQSGIVYIGSAPTNDIVLDSAHGPGVAPLHVQLIANHGGYKLINLADMDIHLGIEGGQVLPPRAVLDLVDGQSFHLGEFALVFRGGQGGGYSGTQIQPAGSGSIGLSLAMPQTRLAPHRSLEGKVTVQNLGGKPGVKVDVELEGLDEECFDIAPGPLLSAGAEKDVVFRLHHRGAKPLAGQWHITIRAVAFRDYPGEEATVTQSVEVLPFFRHRLSFLPPDGAAEPQTEEESLLTPKAKEGSLTRTREASPPEPGGSAPEREPAEDWWTATPEPGPAPAEVVKLQARPVPAGKSDSQADEPGADSVASSPQQAPTAPGQADWGWEEDDTKQPTGSAPAVTGEEAGDWSWEDEAGTGRKPVVVGEEAGDWGWEEDEAESDQPAVTGGEEAAADGWGWEAEAETGQPTSPVAKEAGGSDQEKSEAKTGRTPVVAAGQEAGDWGWESEAETGPAAVAASPSVPDRETPASGAAEEWSTPPEPEKSPALSQMETSPPQIAAGSPEAAADREAERETPSGAEEAGQFLESPSVPIQEDQPAQQPSPSVAQPAPPEAGVSVEESAPPAAPGDSPETPVDRTSPPETGLSAETPTSSPETPVEQTSPGRDASPETPISPPDEEPAAQSADPPPAEQPQQAEASRPSPEAEEKEQAVAASRLSGVTRWWRQWVRSLPFYQRKPDVAPADNKFEAVGVESEAESKPGPSQERPQPEAHVETESPLPGQAAPGEAETTPGPPLQPEAHIPTEASPVSEEAPGAAAQTEISSPAEQTASLEADAAIRTGEALPSREETETMAPPVETPLQPVDRPAPVEADLSTPIIETASSAAEEPVASVQEEEAWAESGSSPLEVEKPIVETPRSDETLPEDIWSRSVDEATPEAEKKEDWREVVAEETGVRDRESEVETGQPPVVVAEEAGDWGWTEEAETGQTAGTEAEETGVRDRESEVETGRPPGVVAEEARSVQDEKTPEEAVTEDWWGIEFEADVFDSLPDEKQVLKLEASEASPPEKAPAGETEPARSSPEPESWWAFEEDSRPEKEVIKLKADAPARAEEASKKKEQKEKTSEPEEWWAADG